MTAAEALAATSPEGLLRTYAALTHHLHEAEHPTPGLTIIQSEKVTDLRRQRDLVAEELLRRIEPVDPEHPAMPPILFAAEACDSWVEQVTRLHGWEVRVTQTDGTVTTGELIRGTLRPGQRRDSVRHHRGRRRRRAQGLDRGPGLDLRLLMPPAPARD